MRKIALHALLAAVSVAALAAPAAAQLAPMPGPGGPAALPPMPAQNLAGPVARPTMPRAADVGTGAGPTPVQPAGGFMVEPPRPDASDPALRMNLDNARAYSAKIQSDGQAALVNMTGKNAEQSPVAQLPNAPIVGQSDLESLVKSQRNIRVLNQQTEEAKKAVELWGILYNNEHAKQWRDKEEKVLEARKKEEEATKQREQQAQAAQAAAQASAGFVTGGGAIAAAMASPPPPVAPKVVEVAGGQALLLVPGKGEVWSRAGTSLSGGYRVVSVAPKRVEVSGPNGREVLAFGTEVKAPVAMPAPPRPQVMPQGPAVPASRL